MRPPLSYKYSIPGFILVALGLIMTLLFLTVNFRFELPVFAIVSSYMETSFFKTFTTNFADELIMLLLLAGFVMLALSEEKDENALPPGIRGRAIITAVTGNTIFMILSILFIYGAGFMTVMIINIFMPFAIYLVALKIYKKKP